MLAAALMEEEETDEDEDDAVDEATELMNKLKAAGLNNAIPGRKIAQETPVARDHQNDQD